MKYIRFTYVDSKTGVPLSIEPAKNGPKIPEGVVPTFDIESSRSSQAPVVYGFIQEGDENLLNVSGDFFEVSEENFFSTFKNELKERARVKRKQVEQAGVEVNDQYVATTIEDQNRIANMVTTLINDPEMESIDFEYAPTQWIAISRALGLEIGKAVGRHVQSCFTWCKNIHQEIDELDLSLETLDAVLPILQEINSFGMPEVLEEEPTGD